MVVLDGVGGERTVEFGGGSGGSVGISGMEENVEVASMLVLEAAAVVFREGQEEATVPMTEEL